VIKVPKGASGAVSNAFAFGFVLYALAVVAQTSPPQGESLQQKVQQMQTAMAANEQQLHSYQWVESTTLTVKARSIPTKRSLCRYAADGTVVKTALGASAQHEPGPRGGPFKHIAEAKKEKIQNEVEQIQSLVQTYLPFNPEKIKEVLRAGKVFFEHDGTNSDAVILADYAKPGDQLRISLNQTTKQIDRISIKTYLDGPEDGVDVDVAVDIRFAILPDGTMYPALMSIEAPSKKLSITTANSKFSKVAS
jgi:hypothetical protein